jgi:hypothetical protein
MADPLVDVTIAVHSATRPIARAVASIVDHTAAVVRVNVVAHNIDPEVIRANLGHYAEHEGVRLLSLQDGVRSPAGPMNLGLTASDARFVSVVGSDDELAPGAIDSWLALQRETGASAVIARIHLGARGSDPYPPIRRGRRTRRLSARKDRLAYRSAPLGLVDRARHGELRFTEGLPSGEDLAYSAALWFTGDRIAYDLRGPAYLVHDDADDRVTYAPRQVSEDFAFLDAIESTTWFGSLGAAERTALAVKLIRVHFFDAVLARAVDDASLTHHRDALLQVADRIESLGPGATRLLARVDRRVIAALGLSAPSAVEVRRLLGARWAYRSAGALLPRNPFLALHRQAPLRTLYAGLRAKGATG